MFVSKNDFKLLQERIASLEDRVRDKLDIEANTKEKNWFGDDIYSSISVKKVVEQILEHLRLTIKLTPAKEESFILKVKNKKKKNKTRSSG